MRKSLRNDRRANCVDPVGLAVVTAALGGGMAIVGVGAIVYYSAKYLRHRWYHKEKCSCPPPYYEGFD